MSWSLQILGSILPMLSQRHSRSVKHPLMLVRLIHVNGCTSYADPPSVHEGVHTPALGHASRISLKMSIFYTLVHVEPVTMGVHVLLALHEVERVLGFVAA